MSPPGVRGFLDTNRCSTRGIPWLFVACTHLDAPATKLVHFANQVRGSGRRRRYTQVYPGACVVPIIDITLTGRWTLPQWWIGTAEAVTVTSLEHMVIVDCVPPGSGEGVDVWQV